MTNQNEVQNPEFPFPGLYSVHATVDVITSDRTVRLRSNEQLVPVGGSHAMARYTYGHLMEVAADGKTATLDLGSRHKVEPGDQFEHFSKLTPWTMTITRVAPDHAWGSIELRSPRSDDPPRPGMGATLRGKK